MRVSAPSMIPSKSSPFLRTPFYFCVNRRCIQKAEASRPRNQPSGLQLPAPEGTSARRNRATARTRLQTSKLIKSRSGDQIPHVQVPATGHRKPLRIERHCRRTWPFERQWFACAEQVALRYTVV